MFSKPQPSQDLLTSSRFYVKSKESEKELINDQKKKHWPVACVRTSTSLVDHIVLSICADSYPGVPKGGFTSFPAKITFLQKEIKISITCQNKDLKFSGWEANYSNIDAFIDDFVQRTKIVTTLYPIGSGGPFECPLDQLNTPFPEKDSREYKKLMSEFFGMPSPTSETDKTENKTNSTFKPSP